MLEPQRLREAGEAGRRLVIIEHRPRGSRTGLAHKVSLNPFDPNSFLSCGEEDGIGLRVRRRNEGDQGCRDVPRLLRTKCVAPVGDPRPEVDGDTVGSPLPCRRGQVSVRPQTIVLLCREQGFEHNLHHLLGLLVPRGALGDLERGQCPLVRPGCLPESSQRCLLPTDCQVS